MSSAIKIHKVDIQHNKIEAMVQIGELRSVYVIDLYTKPGTRIDKLPSDGEPFTVLTPARERTDPEIKEINNSIIHLKLDIKRYLIKTIEEALDVD